MTKRKVIPFLSGLILLSLLALPSAWGAKANSSKKQLEEIATHIEVGKVQAIYSRTNFSRTT